MRPVRVAFLLLAALLLPMAWAPARADEPARFTPTEIGQLTLEDAPSLDCTGVHGVVAAMDEAGRVVGAWSSSRRRMAPFLWTGTELLRLKVGGGGGIVFGIGADGTLVGVKFPRTRTDPCRYPDNPQPVRWIATDLRAELLPLPEGTTGGIAWAAAADGTVVGSVVTVTGASQPVRWGADGPEALAMPPFPDGDATGGEALAIGADGTIAGYVERVRDDLTVERQAVAWRGGLAEALTGDGSGTWDRAWAVGADGTLVGAVTDAATGESRAARWDGGALEVLPLPEGAVASEARDIDGAGRIVGNLWGEDGARAALLWEGDTVVDLGEVTEGLQGRHLIRADAIDDLGQVAVVAEDDDGVRWALRLDPIVQQ